MGDAVICAGHVSVSPPGVRRAGREKPYTDLGGRPRSRSEAEALSSTWTRGTRIGARLRTGTA